MSTRPLSLAEARRLGQGSAHLDADPTYARFVMRRVSPGVSWLICRFTSLSADAVTFLSIVSGIAGGLLVAPGSLATNMLALILLQLAYLLDVVDGEVARIRGTASPRGTYLDLIGHFLQNRALYAGAGLSLIWLTGGAWWALTAAFLALGFTVPFGHYALIQTRGPSADATANPDHGPRVAVARPSGSDPIGLLAWLYRRLSFLWAYPASMNVFCLALVVDLVRAAAGDSAPLAVPGLLAIFGPTLAVKQIGNALRILQRGSWTS
ncbi:MAG: CDP-alcohol phosphatidyltransferase family protein [Chloroflexi bacterium]|nr:CDP-alcohol phosphatidyltransferase family protein [Chloroflexota bacterium]